MKNGEVLLNKGNDLMPMTWQGTETDLFVHILLFSLVKGRHFAQEGLISCSQTKDTGKDKKNHPASSIFSVPLCSILKLESLIPLSNVYSRIHTHIQHMNIDRCELTRKHPHSHMSTQTRTHMLKFMQAHMSSQPMSWGLSEVLSTEQRCKPGCL